MQALTSEYLLNDLTWWDPGVGQHLKSIRGNKTLGDFYSTVRNPATGKGISVKTAGRWEKGSKPDERLLKTLFERYRIDIRELHSYSAALNRQPWTLRGLPHSRLYTKVESKLLRCRQLEVPAPPGMLHRSVCQDAAQSLQKFRPKYQNVSSRSTLKEIWKQFAKELGFGRYIDFKQFAGKAQAGRYLFIIDNLDMLCSRMLSKPKCEIYAEEIIIWLDELVTELKCPVAICGKLCVTDIVRLIDPSVGKSTHIPELIEFETYTACTDDEWAGWSAKLLGARSWSMAAKNAILRAVKFNPGALEEAVEATDELSALEAIEQFHREAAKQVFGMIPEKYQRAFLEVATSAQYRRSSVTDLRMIQQLLANAGFDRRLKEWSPLWEGEWKKLAGNA